MAVKEADFKTIQNMTALFPDNLCYGLGLHPLYIQEHAENDLILLEQALKIVMQIARQWQKLVWNAQFPICLPMNFGQSNVIF